MNILITGSSGYIGSCLYEKIINKYSIFCIDKKKSNQKNFIFLNLLNKNKLYTSLKNKQIDLVIHLAGQSTIDGIKNKKLYLLNNIVATQNLVSISNRLKINRIIFASTASVYENSSKPLLENSKINPKNIYAYTKLQCEKIIKKEFSKKNKSYVILRFFNVCGSLYDLKIGENHQPETHLIPLLIKKIIKGGKFKIYGSNYDTFDGTCIRDYVHIKDLCEANLKIIKLINKRNMNEIFNIGSSKGHSVLEVIKKATKLEKNSNFSYDYINKRPGDLAHLVCSIKKAKKKLNWKPKNSSLRKILIDEIKWRKYLNNKNKN